jgi:hypothetical protein
MIMKKAEMKKVLTVCDEFVGATVWFTQEKRFSSIRWGNVWDASERMREWIERNPSDEFTPLYMVMLRMIRDFENTYQVCSRMNFKPKAATLWEYTLEFRGQYSMFATLMEGK